MSVETRESAAQYRNGGPRDAVDECDKPQDEGKDEKENEEDDEEYPELSFKWVQGLNDDFTESDLKNRGKRRKEDLSKTVRLT